MTIVNRDTSKPSSGDAGGLRPLALDLALARGERTASQRLARNADALRLRRL